MRPAAVQEAQPPHPVALIFRATLASLKFVQRKIEFVRATTRGAELGFRRGRAVHHRPAARRGEHCKWARLTAYCRTCHLHDLRLV